MVVPDSTRLALEYAHLVFDKESVYSIPSAVGALPVAFQVLDFVGRKKRLHGGAHSCQAARSEGFVTVGEG